MYWNRKERPVHQEEDHEDWSDKYGSPELTHGLTPCFSPRPSVLDLHDGQGVRK